MNNKKLAAVIKGEENILNLEENVLNGTQDGYSIFGVDKVWEAI